MARKPQRKAPSPTLRAGVRCAIYTRKSSDEGLDKDFNSLDAQREACEAYVRSQVHEGWAPLSDRFDDGGYSGGTIDRPALQRLLARVEAGEVDIIVVYKLDRLSRSLLDFLKLHEFLESHGVGLVSITQSIATNTPHGRMMVNVLLSFAQYEREIIAERTRDKMSAARRRGRWTGGMPPLGYDVAPEGGRLVVNETEAEQVRAIFELYTERRSLVETANELNRRVWRRKSWTTREGRHRRGKAWDKTNLHSVLTDPIYAGLQKLRGETFRGEHPAIVSKATFRKVQEILAGNRANGGARNRNDAGALLRGMLRCAACDAPMIHSWTRKGARVYRYYVCTRSQKNGADACPSRTVNAERIERFVVDKVQEIGRDPELRAAVASEVRAQSASERKALVAEQRRAETDLKAARAEVDALVTSASRANGHAAQAILERLAAGQARVNTLLARIEEIRTGVAALADRDVGEADLNAALESFAPVWDALLIPERERILQTLVERVLYDGRTEEIGITFRPTGIAALAQDAQTEPAC